MEKHIIDSFQKETNSNFKKIYLTTKKSKLFTQSKKSITYILSNT